LIISYLKLQLDICKVALGDQARDRENARPNKNTTRGKSLFLKEAEVRRSKAERQERRQRSNSRSRDEIAGAEVRYPGLIPGSSPERQDAEVGWRESNKTADAAPIMEGNNRRERQRALEEAGFLLCSCLTSTFYILVLELGKAISLYTI
jgi:hypothetical protein